MGYAHITIRYSFHSILFQTSNASLRLLAKLHPVSNSIGTMTTIIIIMFKQTSNF